MQHSEMPNNVLYAIWVVLVHLMLVYIKHFRQLTVQCKHIKIKIFIKIKNLKVKKKKNKNMEHMEDGFQSKGLRITHL